MGKIGIHAMKQNIRALGLVLLGLGLTGCAAPPVEQEVLSPVNSAAMSPSLADLKRNEAIMAELQQFGAVDPEAHRQLMEDLGKSDPSIWPLVMQQFRATQAYRQRVWQREMLAMQKQSLKRLPPICPAVADQYRASTSAQKLIAENIPAEENPSQKTLQASYPGSDALRHIPGSKQLALCHLAFCTEIQGYGSYHRCESHAFKPGQNVLLYAEVEEFSSTPTPQGYRTMLKSTYRIVDATGRCLVEKTFEPTEDICQNLRCDFFLGYRIAVPKDFTPGEYRLLLTVEDLEGRKRADAEISFSCEN